MDSWSYAAEGKTVSNSDMTVRCKDTLVDWDSKGCTLGNNMSVPSQQSVQNASFPVITGKQLSMGDGFCDKVGGGRTADQLMSISGALSGVVESNSRLSRSLMEGHANQESSLIDLKLGGFLDHRDVRSSSLFGGNPRSELSVPTKRARAGGASSQTAYCQVYGCSKDLSSSKDYHKRHKVCEVHSKTSRVVVNGIEQRFCQQCSRFHLLSEFDDGKRSCRKRLAGHNMRRRKPQVGIHSGGPARVLQSYNAGRFQGAAFSAASFVCQDLLPGGFLQSDKNGLNDLCGQYKFEDETNYFSLSAVPNTNEGLDSKSNFSYGYEKQFSSFNVSGASDSTGNDLQSSNSVSRSLFQETSLGNDEYIVFDTASAIQELPGIPASKIAPSLLSSQSQNFSQSSRNSLASSLVMLGNDQSSTSNYSEKLIGVGSRASFAGLSSKLSSSALSSKVSTDLGSLLIPDASASRTSKAVYSGEAGR